MHANFDNKTIVITGGAGFVGSNLAFYFQEHCPSARVIVFDRFRSEEVFASGNPTSLGHFKNLIGFRGEVIVGDINRVEDRKRLEGLDFDVLFHQAAISDTTALNQELVMQTNHLAFLDLLEICLKKGARMVYASSAGAYGNSPAPNRVGEGENPENVYGFSKLMMDMSVRALLEKDPKLPIVGLRYFNVYGRREFYKAKTASMVLQLGLQALREKRVRLFEFGEQKRDFVYIDDVVQANVLAACAKKGGVYNVGSGVARDYNAIVENLKKHLGDFEVEYIKNPYSFFQTHTEADISLSKQDLGYEPRFSLEEGIGEYVGEICRIFEEGRC